MGNPDIYSEADPPVGRRGYDRKRGENDRNKRRKGESTSTPTAFYLQNKNISSRINSSSHIEASLVKTSYLARR